ncbi:MAG: ribosome biogenesis GTPase Der [Dehalococcoidia bacterium]|nr:ribosome biogenesis GTPase Der [Dehalococcoidia bacterium]
MTSPEPLLPIVAIVGRPNVGKSALFNRLTRRNNALVEDLPGTTRDRIYGLVEWRGRNLRIVDTGGLGDEATDPFGTLIREGVAHALAESQAVVFVVDGQSGPTGADYEVADMLRKASQPVLLCVNKGDTGAAERNLVEFYALGLGEPMSVSALHGRGAGDLLDAVLELIPEAPEDPPVEPERVSVAIVGRPNVGKSSLTNAILGEKRAIVSDVPGTTRDAIDTSFDFGGQPMLLVDTAGIRRAGRIERGVERHSVQRAERAVDRSDVVFVVIDQQELLVAQDTHIAGYAATANKGIVILVNKWDLAEDRATKPEAAQKVDAKYKFIPWAPVIFTSAMTGEGVQDALELAIHISEVRRRRVQTSELNRVLHRAMAEHGPPTIRHKKLKLYFATQPEVAPPTFVLFVNDPALVHFSYERFLENTLRSNFDFEGTAIRVIFRGRAEGTEEPS